MENKACRICWNTNGWVRPSGEARHLEIGSFAAKYGFGHEEWLFNYEWLLSGYRYGFLQPIGKHYNSYVNKTFDALLYTVNESGHRLIVGTISEVYVPDEEELLRAHRAALERKWIEQAQTDLSMVNVDPRNYSTEVPRHIANIRFRPENVSIFEPMIPLSDGHPLSNRNRYHPFNWTTELWSQAASHSAASAQSPGKSGQRRSEHTRIRTSIDGTSYDPTHIRMQNQLADVLEQRFGKENVFYERANVDLSINMPGGACFIEIKTATTAKRCIREALGQLLEYAHHPDKNDAVVFVVIGHAPAFPDDIAYLARLRRQYQLPIYYSKYDWESKSLVDWPIVCGEL